MRPGQSDVQGGRIEVGAVVGGGERLHLVVPAAFAHLLGDHVAQRLPPRRRLAAELGGQPQRTVHRQPAHHLRVHVMTRRTADLPDAVIRLHPTAFDGEHHLADQVPVGVGERVGSRRWPPACGTGRRSTAPPDRKRPAALGHWRHCPPAPGAIRRNRAASRSRPPDRGSRRTAHRAGAAVRGRASSRSLRAASSGSPRPRRWSPAIPAPTRSSRRRGSSSSGSPSCGHRRSPRAATWCPRP